tara:strand:+ start:1361 stop:2476 length:1116 start_codon:yes stop_codon:yes gene_type:complete
MSNNIFSSKLKTKYAYITKACNKKEKANVKRDIVEEYLQQNIPYKRIKKKVTCNNFTIPELKEYKNIINNNYTINQLKIICKNYHLRSNGNKDDLNKRCYNYLYYSYHILYIQKNYRGHLLRNYIKLHGPGFKKRSLCTNDQDFCSLDELNEIPYTQFFSFKDERNFIFGFDIKSIYNLYIKNKTRVENPFTKEIIHKNVFLQMLNYINYSRLLKIKLNIDYERLEKLSEEKTLEIKILNIFQQMDSLGNYTNMNWFNNLSKHDLIKFLKELIDIWNYRANLENNVKREICPPNGNPFSVLHINVINIEIHPIFIIKKNIANVMFDMVHKGINDSSKSLGCYYILCALTLVSSEAAEAMPWLYESVSYQIN